MAKAIRPKEATQADALGEETESRLADCRAQKADVEPDLREAYFLTRPRLSRQILSTTQPGSPPKDDSDLATGIGGEVVEDFATEVINAFMPPHAPWASSEPGEGVPDDVWQQVKPQAEADDQAIFRGIRASNFDSELATMLIPDGALGTVAMVIQDKVASNPIFCEHTPLRELEINIGPEGVDDRFVVRWVRARNVRKLIPAAKIPKSVNDRIEKGKGNDWVECRWGYWRDWSTPEDVVWKFVVMVDGKVIDSGDYRGEGSCPLIVGRFSPDSLYAFGNGPTLDSLPYLRIIDVIAAATQDRVDIAIAPPFAFPDDGIMNFDGGIESGKAYPKARGSRNEIEPLYFQGDPNLGFYTLADLEKSVRRKHFADYPEQQGKTPPSATQWLDEMVKAQRRIGTPGQKFWREFPAEVFLRFKYLLQQRGVIKPLAKDKRAITTRPRNPATKAQENQEVQVASQLLGFAKGYFPMTSQAAIDEMATIKNIKDKMGDKLVVLRDAAQVNSLVAGILQGMAGGGGAGGQGGGQPGQGAA